MNLTLNEKLRFQKQAGVINECQYKKLLKESGLTEPSFDTTEINSKRIYKLLDTYIPKMNEDQIFELMQTVAQFLDKHNIKDINS